MMSSSGSTNKSGAADRGGEDATQSRSEESPSVPSVSQSNQSSTDKSNISYKRPIKRKDYFIKEQI